MDNFEVIFLGTSGSCAHNGGKRPKYGTNSSCVAVKAGNETIIFDTGTGICGLKEPFQHAHIFYSHYHADHIDGLLFYSEMFNPQKRFDFYGDGDVRSVIDSLLSPPIYPVGLNAFNADLSFHTVEAGNDIVLSDSVTIKTCNMSHPGGAVGYRVEYGGKSFCYCLDVELANHRDDEKLLKFTNGANLLVLDAFFDDGKVIPAWGHSSWKECAEWAKRINAERLALSHYHFNLTDNDIDMIEEKARKVFPQTFTAADFMRVAL